MEKKTIIKVENVTKQYRLGAIGGATLRGDLQSLMARIRKKEDPNSKIGAKTYSGNQKFMALDGISFEVKEGERIGIIGHNGAGKSTFLKVLSRVTAPTSGTISYNGRIASMLEVGTGFHPELTGRENVYMNGAILGMTKTEIDRKFDDIVKFAEMEKFIDTPVKRYSSGMYVKLAFAVAAHLDSEIMIMDEVLAVGDMAFQQKCISKMTSLSVEHGRTILYVSHNMNTIRQFCTRCIVLSKGKVIFNGDVEDAIQIYSNNNDGDDGNSFVNLKERKRPNVITGDVLMNSIEFLGKEQNSFIQSEPIKIRLKWKANKDLNDVRFRAILRYGDDSAVGLVQSPTICDCKIGLDYQTDFEFDTGLIAQGKYFFSIAMYQRDDVGNSVILDHVTRAISFDILSNMESDKLITWEHQYWGSIDFPELKIINRN